MESRNTHAEYLVDYKKANRFLCEEKRYTVYKAIVSSFTLTKVTGVCSANLVVKMTKIASYSPVLFYGFYKWYWRILMNRRKSKKKQSLIWKLREETCVSLRASKKAIDKFPNDYNKAKEYVNTPKFSD